MTKLYPNCSEIVWKLNVEKSTKEKILEALENKKEEKIGITYMAGDFPNTFLWIMINCLKEEKKRGYDLDGIKLKMVSNDNGENWGFIKEGFRLAKLCLNKEMGIRKAQDLLRKLFDEEDD